MEKCLAKEPTLELMALTFIGPYAVLLQHLQMSQPLRVTGTHPIKRDLLEWVFFSLPLDFFFFLAEEEELMEERDCSISSEKWQKSLLALPSQQAAGVGCGLKASCDPQALDFQRRGGNNSHFVTVTLLTPFQAGHPGPVSPAMGHLLSHTSVLFSESHGALPASRGAAQGRHHPPLAQLPNISTFLE